MIDSLLSSKYFVASVLIVVAVVVSKIAFMLFRRVVVKITSRTKTTLDDRILQSVELPLEVAVILTSIYVTLRYYLLVIEESNELINDIFLSLGIVIGLWLFGRTVNGIVKWYSESQPMTRDQKTVYFSVRNIFYFLALTIGLLVILHIFGVEITPLLASLGIGGLAVALALQPTLTNYFSGVYITADGAMKIGDYIESDSGVKGYVEKIGWRSTKIRTVTDNLVTVPNSKLAESIVTNFYDPSEEFGVIARYGVAYGSDLDKVEKVTLDAAKKVMQTSSGGVKSFEPKFRFEKFGDSNIDLFVVLRSKDFNSQWLVMNDFIKEIDKVYKKNSIEISWPVRKVFMEKL